MDLRTINIILPFISLIMSFVASIQLLLSEERFIEGDLKQFASWILLGVFLLSTYTVINYLEAILSLLIAPEMLRVIGYAFFLGANIIFIFASLTLARMARLYGFASFKKK